MDRQPSSSQCCWAAVRGLLQPAAMIVGNCMMNLSRHCRSSTFCWSLHFLSASMSNFPVCSWRKKNRLLKRQEIAVAEIIRAAWSLSCRSFRCSSGADQECAVGRPAPSGRCPSQGMHKSVQHRRCYLVRGGNYAGMVLDGLSWRLLIEKLLSYKRDQKIGLANIYRYLG